jgi:carbamoyl-phosphate synthase small subunit
MKGIVALEDGTVFEGESFGAPGEAVGEVVFNTSMTGYQEVLTDPSYCSQIVTMTYPLIGNYGINESDVESARIQVAGFLVKEACSYPSNFTSQKTLSAYLKENKIIGIEGIDTRKLTRHIRVAGAMKGALCASENPIASDCIAKARAWQGLQGLDLAAAVTCKKPYSWDDPHAEASFTAKDKRRFSVVAFDFGIKFNILRLLQSYGCDVTVVPASTTAEEALALKPDGIFLSNGPGDPAAVTYAVEAIRKLIGRLPIFGICLGHQLLGLALGAKTYKLKFGHRGANHPVKNLKNGSIQITSQNHGFCVDMDSLAKTGVKMTHINLNDTTCEGLADLDRKFFSVQYHPEASPGPHESRYLFEHFIGMMKG